MVENATTISSLRDAILTYLESRPGAEDTLEGITDWWLGGRPAGAARVGDLRVAVQELVACGLLVTRTAPDRKVVWYRSVRRWPTPFAPSRRS